MTKDQEKALRENGIMIAKKQTGEISLTKELFSEEQHEIFEKVAAIADKNPVFDWTKPEHNQDFCLVENTIEAVKNFYLKTQYVSGLSIANMEQNISGTGDDQAAICTVKIWKDGNPRTVIMSGAATFKECGGIGFKNSRTGKQVFPNKRAFHDMVARAQTRAFKAAMEAYMGFPFINLMIQSIFGGYNVTGKPEDEGANMKDVTEQTAPEEPNKTRAQQLDPETRQIAGSIWKQMEAAELRGIITRDEINDRWERVKMFYGNVDAMIREQKAINEIIREKEFHG